MYESYYGLSSKPFQLTPDPEFFYASKLHKRAMSYLQYGLSQAEGFIVITGDIGTGKTTIANSLLKDIETDIHAAQIVTPKLSPDEIVKMVVSKFGIDTAGKSKTDLLESLQEYLQQLAKAGKRALLIVDEAQNLPLETIEELRMLSNFQNDGKPLLQSFLLGQAELQPILRAPNMEQFRQRIVASCHLAPLNLEEMTSYIKYRLEHAGNKRDDLFSDGAFSSIHEFSGGVPRKVNTLLDRVLLYGFLEELETFSEEDTLQVIEEVKAEMFLPENEQIASAEKTSENTGSINAETPSASSQNSPTQSASTATEDNVDENTIVSEEQTPPPLITRNGNVVQEAQYYKDMLEELVDALDDAIKHKVKLTQYIDKLLKKKYQTYVRLKSDDK
ncbi:XrtA/PEP-CTERM system-associated ATPase [Glaciecola petra]|uniref:XrtA-associated ATPase n=1 Tax=Glaciecola petra TaxID=3075602 RepID=A0ABU2ZLU2_9ALTE|nr:XrtA/PEP-CTERM system-associated ATPase [Aestuariibacter sp. P117]MDT0593592.1 XrtA-associated ATPase [Aestuariibacter sp. P117]